MPSKRPAFATLALLAVAWWLHLRHFLRLMPERIATHFGGSGYPNGWMSRSSLGTFDLIFLALVLGVVIGSAYLIRVLPVSLINVPHRDYWFAPERRRESHERLLVHMLWMACLMVGFLIGVNHLMFMANLQPVVQLSNIGLILLGAAFLAAIIGWIIRLYRLFPRPQR